MSRATKTLLTAVGEIDPTGSAANDEISAEQATTGDAASTDLTTWIDALALTLAAGLRVGARGLDHSEAPEVMDVEQTAAFLGVDRKTVYDYAGRGEIPHRRLGKRLLFSRTALMAWLSSPCKAASHR